MNINKKPVQQVAGLTTKVIEYTGSAMGLFLKRIGEEDLAYKIIVGSRKVGQSAGEGVVKATGAVNNVYSNVKEEIKDKTQDKVVKSTMDRANEIGKTIKDSVVTEAKNVYNQVKDIDTTKITDELNNFKNVISEKATNISNSEAVKKVEEKIGKKFDVESLKSKLTEIVKTKLDNKNFDFDSVELDHSNDPFYDPSTFVEEEPEIANKSNFTTDIDHEIQTNVFEESKRD